MPLSPYQYRPATPPLADPPALVSGNAHARRASSHSSWSSPDSIDLLTPVDPSPSRHHGAGPILLPKSRPQDQLYDGYADLPVIEPLRPKGHRRVPSQHFVPLIQTMQPVQTRPGTFRSSTSPPDLGPVMTPLSAVSSFTGFSAGYHSDLNSDFSAVNSPISITPSIQRRLGHSRSTSAPSIDKATLSRYVYPTHRQAPRYITSEMAHPFVETPSTSHIYGDSFNNSENMDPNEPLTDLNEYLRAASPPINLVALPKDHLLSRKDSPFAWWDIRNIRPWKGFDLETIMSTPSFPELLKVPVSTIHLPKPLISTSRLHPTSETALVEVVREFYMNKINAALSVGQGARHLAMRPGRGPNGPSFIASYQDDVQRTILGNGQGRVVGMVIPYELWNSGNRTEPVQKRVRYLTGLAHLHYLMREHQCRYGFILSETELVCARAGSEDTPYFGYLELTPPIETREQEGLTACLALWYLHMLAKDHPLRGQPGWKLAIGAPAERTRSKIKEKKDSWIPEPKMWETRLARRVRGWVMPTEKYNKKRETGKVWA